MSMRVLMEREHRCSTSYNILTKLANYCLLEINKRKIFNSIRNLRILRNGVTWNCVVLFMGTPHPYNWYFSYAMNAYLFSTPPLSCIAMVQFIWTHTISKVWVFWQQFSSWLCCHTWGLIGQKGIKIYVDDLFLNKASFTMLPYCKW